MLRITFFSFLNDEEIFYHQKNYDEIWNIGKHHGHFDDLLLGNNNKSFWRKEAVCITSRTIFTIQTDGRTFGLFEKTEKKSQLKVKFKLLWLNGSENMLLQNLDKIFKFERTDGQTYKRTLTEVKEVFCYS